ncbi:MAG: hypothetical protein K6L76_07900 [Agarilytica sp.]
MINACHIPCCACFYKNIHIVLLTFFLVSGCSTKAKREVQLEADVVFRTKITTSNLKHFEVRIKNGSWTAYKIISSKSGISTTKRRRLAEKRLQSITQKKLARVAFCSDGYWLMEVQTLRENLKVRGECNDIAAERDKERFPNTLSQW